MHSAIRFSGSSSRGTSSSMEVASAAAEPQLSVSSIARRRSADRDDALSLLDPAVRLPTSTSSMASALSQRSLRSASHPSATVAGDNPGAAPTASSSYTGKGNNGDALLRQKPGNPPTRVPSSFAASVDTRASEASSHSTRGTSGSSRRDNLDPAAPQSRAATESPHTHPGRFFANLPWIPPPPIYGTPLPDSSNMNRHYAHYYDPTGATSRAPFCYPGDVPLRAQGHRSDVSGAEWPTPSDLPLPSMFPMPPRVLPAVSASAAEAAARGMVAAPQGWAIPPPFLYPPPPPPPWWFYGSPPAPLPASSSGSSASSTGSSRHASSSSRASARSAAQPSRDPPADAARLYAEAAAPSRHAVAVPAGSVETPVAVASRGDAGGCHAAKQRSVASSGFRYAARHTVGTGRAARRSLESLSASSAATSSRSARTTRTHSDPPQGVERRVYVSSGSGSNDTPRRAKGKTVQVAPRRTNAAHCVEPNQLQVYGEDAVRERAYNSVTTRMKHAVSAAEAYLEKMEHLYRQLRSRYEEVAMSPGRVTRYGAGITADEEVEEKLHRRTAPAATTRATRGSQEKGLLHLPERAFSPQTHVQPTVPLSHAKRPVSPARSAAQPSAVEPSLPLSSSSSETSATSLRRELHLLESQWQRLEELKRHGGGGTTPAVAPTTAPLPSTATAIVGDDLFTNRRFLQLIKDRKHLLMSAA